jgi:hypothetical protein
MDHPRPNLRFVDGKDLSGEGLKLKGLEVDGSDGQQLGSVEGFILDVSTGRPYHVVVGAGHWFSHKHVLLPIGHAMLSSDGSKLIADLTQERVKRFPGFDKSVFEKLTEEDIKRMDRETAAAGFPDEVVVLAWEDSGHYRYPEWWQESYYAVPAADRRR